MDSYLLIKLIHILAAVVVMGTGAGIAFFMLMAYRSNNPQAIAITTRHVILGDWLFTTPAVITQLATGLWLMHRLGYPFQSLWFAAVAGLFVLIGLCWLPVLRIQYRLHALATESVADNRISPEFTRLMRQWVALGIPAFVAILAILWLMVFKPAALF